MEFISPTFLYNLHAKSALKLKHKTRQDKEYENFQEVEMSDIAFKKIESEEGKLVKSDKDVLLNLLPLGCLQMSQ